MKDINESISDYNDINNRNITEEFFKTLTNGQVEKIRLQIPTLLEPIREFTEDKKYPFVYNYAEDAKKESKYLETVYNVIEGAFGKKIINPEEFSIISLAYLKQELKVEEHFAEFIVKQNYAKQVMIYNWQLYKQVYKFNEEFLEMLINDTGYENIPSKILNENLPYDSFAIDNKFTVNGIHFRSVIVSKGKDKDNEDVLITFFIMDNKDHDFFYTVIPLEGERSIEDIITGETQYSDKFKDILKHILPLIVYLCSSNKEVRYIEKKNGIEKNRSKYIKKKNIEMYDVGYDIGATIKSTKTIYVNHSIDKTESKNGTPKRPHTRCGHFHHFWSGSKDNKTLIVKYIPPIFVKGGNIKPIVHNVKG